MHAASSRPLDSLPLVLIRLVSMAHTYAVAMPTKGANFSFHIEDIEIA